ncbi:MAG: YaiI/YqxD family protein [Magnetococcales bacterium]|nr:YaiI/YqxD family protein [Magnetococcales bacterium]
MRPEIYVDADSCPVKQEVVRVAERHSLAVHMVSNQWMRLPNYARMQQQVVAGGLDQADDWIVLHAGDRDIVITADIPLAARCLQKGSLVLGPSGRPFDTDNIGTALAMRDLNAYLRDLGTIKGSGMAFSRQDRSRFLCALEEAIQTILRRS